MQNFSYHVPFYVVNNGIATSGHSADLQGGQLGLFDRQNFSVATTTGQGKEFFFAQGNIGGKGWYGETITQSSHKSPFFLGKDVTNMYVSLPQTLQNEEWIIGFNGSTSSKSLSFKKGEATRVKFYFHGDATFRFFGGPKEYVVSYTPKEDCTTPCTEPDCEDPITDCLTHTQALINKINNHTELHKFGVQAKLVNAPFTAATANMTKWALDVIDNGDSLALQAVQGQAPVGVTVTRIARVGAKSTYQFCQRTTAADPAAFAQSGSVLQAVCGTCPAGSTTVAAKDVYIVKRVVTPSTDLTTLSAQDTYADTVGTAYSVTVDADKVFLGLIGAVASVKIKIAAGSTVTAIGSDIVTLVSTEAANCVFAAPSTIAWASNGTGIASTRTLRINNLNRLDCAGGDRIADLTAILSGVTGIKIGTLTKIAGVNCVDDYTIQQDSVDCLPEDCLTNNVTFTYDSLPAFENESWTVVPEVVTENAARKCGIRITAGYVDPRFGNCSFDVMDYYDVKPLKMELSLLNEDDSACDTANWPTVHQVKFAREARQTGEYVVRQLIMKTDAYLGHIKQYCADPREREAFDMNLLSMVDRTAFYKLYYVSFKASYALASSRKNEQEKFTAVFAFKESDPNAANFETQILDVLSGKSGVSLHINK
jgi:hypothetical protein